MVQLHRLHQSITLLRARDTVGPVHAFADPDVAYYTLEAMEEDEGDPGWPGRVDIAGPSAPRTRSDFPETWIWETIPARRFKALAKLYGWASEGTTGCSDSGHDLEVACEWLNCGKWIPADLHCSSTCHCCFRANFPITAAQIWNPVVPVHFIILFLAYPCKASLPSS